MIDIPVTRLAMEVPGSRIRVVPAYCATSVTHELAMPVAACPVSRNPLSGVVRITYAPTYDHALEVVSLHDALAWACSAGEGAPRSAEALAAWLAEQASVATAAPVVVRLDLVLNPGGQRLVIRHRWPS